MVRRALGILLCLVGLLLLVQFSTARGRIVALWLLVGGLGLGLKRLPLLRLLGVWGLGWLVQLLLAPSAQTGCRAPVWLRFSPLNLVPECDWSELGINLLYAHKAAQIKALTRPLYAELASRPGYSDMAHTLHFSVTDLLGLGTGSGHLYSYSPPGRRRPLLIFLHGAMGNLQCYLAFWQKFADEQGYAVVCPTFGFGSWYREGGMDAAAEAWRYAQQHLEVEPGPALWVCLSNGATGGVRLSLAHPEMVRRLVLISPVLEPELVGSAEFARAMPSAPLILEGDEDVNVPPSSVERGVAAMRSAGLQPDYRLLHGYDHFLLFSARRLVYTLLSTP